MRKGGQAEIAGDALTLVKRTHVIWIAALEAQSSGRGCAELALLKQKAGGFLSAKASGKVVENIKADGDQTEIIVMRLLVFAEDCVQCKLRPCKSPRDGVMILLDTFFTKDGSWVLEKDIPGL